MQNTKQRQNIPKGWQRTKLGDISNITNGKTNTQDAVVDGEFPLFDRSVAIKRSNKYLFDDTVVILPGEGAEFIPRYYSGKFDLHQRAYAIFPKENTDPSFLFQYLYAKRGDFVQKSVGSTVKSLRLPIIQSIDVFLPPLPEQKKIAEILEAVDEEIQKTDEIISATEKLKNGLMQQLFTRGIGHTKFKKTAVGEMPAEWQIIKLGEVAMITRGGSPRPIESFITSDDNGLNWLKIGDIELGAKYIPTFVLGNHDKPRVASRLGQKGARLASMLQLTTRGIPTIYYGEELGMENVKIPKSKVQDPWELNVPGMGLGRDPQRTPMQWSSSRFSGFSSKEPWLPLAKDYRTRNLKAESKDPKSMFSLYRRLLRLRKSSNALKGGKYIPCDVLNSQVYAFCRKHLKEELLVALNFSARRQKITLPYSASRQILSTSPDTSPNLVKSSSIYLRPQEGAIFQP